MLGLCDMVLRLLTGGPGERRSLMTEEAAIAGLYFGQGSSERIDPALIERLLWWEGIDPGDVTAVRASVPLIRTSVRLAAGPRAA